MEDLLTFVPEQYTHYVTVALTLIGALSVVMASLKPLLEKLPPGARVWVDGLATVLDYLALNTKHLKDRPWPKGKKL